MGGTGPGQKLESFVQRLIFTLYITVQNFIVIGPFVFALWGKIYGNRDVGRSGLSRELKNYIQLFIFTFYITVENLIVIGVSVFAHEFLHSNIK